MRSSRLSRLGPVLVVLAVALSIAAASASAAAGGGSRATADDLLASVQKKGVLRVGIYNFPPYSTLDKKGNWSGLLGDITADIAKVLGTKLKVQVLTAAAYVPSLDAGRVDVIVGISKTAERAKAAVFSTQILYAPDAVAVRSDSALKTLADLNGKTMGVVRGAYGETLTNILIKNGAIKPGKTVIYDSYSTPLLDITNGRIDANVSDVIGINYAVKQNPKLKLRAIYIPPKAEGVEKYDALYYAFSKKKDAASLIAKINGAIKQFMGDGTFAGIYEQYGLGQYKEALLTGVAGT